MLQRGDMVPHFIVEAIDGARFAYVDVWQHHNLVLISLSPESPVPAADAQRIADAAKAGDTAWVVTHEAIEGLPHPAVLVADRWGEIVHVAGLPADGGLPDVDDLREWIHFTQMRCPECEGEAR